jgi:hypothetical protein
VERTDDKIIISQNLDRRHMGVEAISVDLIRQVANDGLHLLKPMLAAIRNNDEKEILRYKDIAPLNILAYEQECLKKLHELTLRKNKQLQDRKIDSNLLRATIAELIELDVSPHLAKECAEQVITNSKSESDISVLVKQAYKLSLVGSTGHTSVLVKQIAHISDYRVRLLMENHTLYPFYAAFLTPIEIRKLESATIEKRSGSILEQARVDLDKLSNI